MAEAYQCDRCGNMYIKSPDTFLTHDLGSATWKNNKGLRSIVLTFRIEPKLYSSDAYNIEHVASKVDVCSPCFKICLAAMARHFGVELKEKDA